MGRVWWLASAGTCALLSACFHDVDVAAGEQRVRPPADASADIDGSSRADGGHRSKDAGRGSADGGSQLDASLLPPEAGPSLDANTRDAGSGRVFHWVKNGPDSKVEEGPVDFTLTCADEQGVVGSCNYRCREDRRLEVPCADVYAIAWARASTQAEPMNHTFCVSVEPTTPGKYGTDTGSVTCHSWTSLPHARPYLWVEQTPSPKSTELSLDWPLRCAKRMPNGALVDVREDCTFRCSMDGIPYRYAAFSTDCIWQGLAPGEHVLRVETTGPSHLGLGSVSRVTKHPFTVLADAVPAVVKEVVSLPALLSVEELETKGIAKLLDAYGVFAATCAHRSAQESKLYSEQLRTYLSYALAIPNATTNATEIEACLSALTTSPAPCRAIQGVPETYLKDGPLDVRLPTDCLDIVAGAKSAGESCITNAECDGFCDRPLPFQESPRGYCAEDWSEYREGIMCRTRGCTEDLYCDSGYCRHVLAPGEACSPVRAGVDCPTGFTCGGGENPRCIPATAKLGGGCRFDRDCSQGSCSDTQKVCVERTLDH